MNATRRVLSPSLISAQKAMLIAPQTTWDIFRSSFNTTKSLFASEPTRQNFLETLDKNAINARVLGQANIGFWRILALYNDMNNPLFKPHGVDVSTFTEGAKLALDRFHEVQISLHRSSHSLEQEADGNEKDKSLKEDTNGSSSVKTEQSDDDAMKDELEAVLAALGGNAGSELMDLNLFEHSWAKEAEEDPESLAAELNNMVTPQYFRMLEITSKTWLHLEKQSNYSADIPSSIKNITLLSARAMELPPPESSEDEEVDYSTPMKDESLEKIALKDADLPIVAQVEVLYDLEQAFTPNEEDDGEGTDDNVKAAFEKLPKPRTSVLVGVFEGYLRGDPEGNKSIRWKLALNRPAWEFPTF